MLNDFFFMPTRQLYKPPKIQNPPKNKINKNIAFWMFQAGHFQNTHVYALTAVYMLFIVENSNAFLQHPLLRHDIRGYLQNTCKGEGRRGAP